MNEAGIPHEWQGLPPESLVAGAGSYSVALASILGTVAISFEQLHAGPQSNSVGGYPRVLENLKQAFLVVPNDISVADALLCHQSIWNWVEKLSSAGDQQELVFCFILPEYAAKGFQEALAVGLCVPVLHPFPRGHAVWSQSGTLSELLGLVTSTIPMDLMSLKVRRPADGKRLALKQLRTAITQSDPSITRAAAQAVMAAFQGTEYHLDLFCRPPSHPHGNLLREWLHAGVTDPVTQDWCAAGRNQLPIWLLEDERPEFL